MNTKRARWIAVMLGCLLLAGGCAKQTVQVAPVFEVQPLVKEMWTPKADNLVFILDASASMSKTHNGFEKFEVGRNVVSRFNKTMPDLAIQVALRSFGHALTYSYEGTVRVYGFSEYSRTGLADALATIIPAGGPSPMEKSFKDVAEDLKATQGKIAMVVVSDGEDMDKGALKAAKDLSAQYGDRLCIYTVLVGDDEAGRELLSNISKLTGCGQAITTDDVDNGAKMADFVTTVLLDKATSWIFKDVKFESDKAVLMNSSYPTLDKIVAILNGNPGISVEIQGHTDSTASAEYNIDLSQRRAETVMNYLESKGIAASRMTAHGYGEGQPIDTNNTEEGKANNRRVELKPVK